MVVVEHQLLDMADREGLAGIAELDRGDAEGLAGGDRDDQDRDRLVAVPAGHDGGRELCRRALSGLARNGEFHIPNR